VSLDRDEPALRKYLADNPSPLTVLYLPPDAAKKVREAYKVRGIPTVLYLDKGGVIKSVTVDCRPKQETLTHIQELGVDTSAAK